MALKRVTGLCDPNPTIISRMNWREATENDLEACFEVEPRIRGDEIVGHDRALRIWKEWTRSLSFGSALLETPARIVAFGASVFVTPEFANQEFAAPRPCLNSRVLESACAGRSVVLPETSLSEPFVPLDLVILSCNYLYDALTPEQIIQAEMMLPILFFEMHVGFRLNRILLETTHPRQYKAHGSSGVWRTVCTFPGHDRALIMLTKKEAFSTSGSVAAPLFTWQKPVLRLRDTDKQLLAEAINGETDAELAQKMNLSLATIKKRWAALFDRIADTHPNLLPDADTRDLNESRGPQKRHRILAWVRSHPEELRPYRWRSQRF